MPFLFWCGHDNWIHRHVKDEFNNNPKRISVTHSVVKKMLKEFRKTGYVTHKHLGCPRTSVSYEIVHKTYNRTEKPERY
jgi:Mn-dependent DtxR family transcriptional regulator